MVTLLLPAAAWEYRDNSFCFEKLPVRDRLAPGVVKQSQAHDNTQFVHRTFAEYLAGEFLATNWVKISDDISKRGHAWLTIFVKNNFNTKIKKLKWLVNKAVPLAFRQTKRTLKCPILFTFLTTF